MVALLLAALYLPTTGHCLLEQAGWLSPSGDCCEQTNPADTSQSVPCGYECCPSELAFYFSSASGVHSPLVAEMPRCLISMVLDVVPRQVQLVPAESPPELPKVWQFSFRTALPPRAPSFVS